MESEKKKSIIPEERELSLRVKPMGQLRPEKEEVPEDLLWSPVSS